MTGFQCSSAVMQILDFQQDILFIGEGYVPRQIEDLNPGNRVQAYFVWCVLLEV